MFSSAIYFAINIFESSSHLVPAGVEQTLSMQSRQTWWAAGEGEKSWGKLIGEMVRLQQSVHVCIALYSSLPSQYLRYLALCQYSQDTPPPTSRPDKIEAE